MENNCPNCGHRYDTQVAPGLKDTCPKCMADFLLGVSVGMDSTSTSNEGMPNSSPLAAGSIVQGMEILEFIGKGGMGYVYKARQPKLNRIVALKVLDPRLAASGEFTSRFNHEAKVLAALSHPNIVQIYDYGQEGDHYFLAMEFVEGATLRQILTSQRLSPVTALRYVPQICDALEYAHAQGVIHRDIKPENILIDQQGNLKIADFGLAKMTAQKGQVWSHATAADRVMGTPHYMAPEQLKGMAAVDHRADIYSLGVVFYEMLTGELPIGHFPIPSASAHVDVRLDEVVLRALERDPERRYQHASEMKDAAMPGQKPSQKQGSVVAGLTATVPGIADASHAKPWGMEVNTFCIFLHLSYFIGYIVPGAGWLLPLIMWVSCRHQHHSIDAHGRAVLNWIVSSLYFIILSSVLCFVLIGIPLVLVVMISVFVFPFIGAVYANQGKTWSYPFAIPFFGSVQSAAFQGPKSNTSHRSWIVPFICVLVSFILLFALSLHFILPYLSDKIPSKVNIEINEK